MVRLEKQCNTGAEPPSSGSKRQIWEMSRRDRVALGGSSTILTPTGQFLLRLQREVGFLDLLTDCAFKRGTAQHETSDSGLTLAWSSGPGSRCKRHWGTGSRLPPVLPSALGEERQINLIQKSSNSKGQTLLLSLTFIYVSPYSLERLMAASTTSKVEERNNSLK